MWYNKKEISENWKNTYMLINDREDTQRSTTEECVHPNSSYPF